MSNVYENGQLTHTNVSFDNFVMYPSAFFVVDLTEDTYSKHYYAGGQRIAARMEQNNALFRENDDTSEDPKPSAAKTNAIEEDFKRYFKDKNVNISFDTQSYREGDIRAMSSSIEELYFYHPDHLGTATFLTDIVGNPYQFFLNLPFGESMAEQRSYTGGFDNRWLFTGKELDESTGLYYFGARFYNPSTSIWLSVDPLVEQTFDAYGYAYNNPVRFVDPTGMAPEEANNGWPWNLLPGVRFIYGEFEIGAGLGYSLNYVTQSGVARDRAGVTHFIMESLIRFDADLSEGSRNIELVVGASVSMTANVKYNWSKNDFISTVKDSKPALSTPVGRIGEFLSANFGLSTEDVTFGIGGGFGIKLTFLSTEVRESISLSYKERDYVNSHSRFSLMKSWSVANKKFDNDLGLWSGNVSVNGRQTNVKVFSGNVIRDGANRPDNIWFSQEYENKRD